MVTPEARRVNLIKRLTIGADVKLSEVGLHLQDRHPRFCAETSTVVVGCFYEVQKE